MEESSDEEVDEEQGVGRESLLKKVTPAPESPLKNKLAPAPVVASKAAATNTESIYDLVAMQKRAAYEPEPPLWTNPCAPWNFSGGGPVHH